MDGSTCRTVARNIWPYTTEVEYKSNEIQFIICVKLFFSKVMKQRDAE